MSTDGPSAPEFQEELAPQVGVYRFSALDEPDEPYIDFPMDGFLEYKDFIKSLRDKYPKNKYPSDEVLDRVKGQDPYDYRNLTTYLADVGNNLAGAIIGKHNGRRFDGVWFAIDPKHQRSEVTKKLLEAIEKDYDEITLVASTFGFDREEEGRERHARRQQALVEYYKRLGFELNTSAESYPHYAILHDPTSPVPMIWRRGA